MRRVDRKSTTAPASLLGAGRAGPKELERARKHFGPPKGEGSFTFRAYKGDDVRHALEALFHGKCAYCESRYEVSGPVDIEHFRPKGGVEGAEHPGYWWLAAEWTNLLPSCLDCNRRRYQPTPIAFASLVGGLDQARKNGFANIQTGKETAFPIAAAGTRIGVEPAPDAADAAIVAEQALLLDPCRDDPATHLLYYIDRTAPLGIVYPAGSTAVVLPALPDTREPVSKVEQAARDAGTSVRGAVSIQTYGLNRLALVQERTRLLRRLEFLGSVVVDMSAIADALAKLEVDEEGATIRDFAIKRARATSRRALAEIRAARAADAPFSQMAKAWIAVFKEDLAKLQLTAG
jgi:hypothetical protein